MKVLIIPENFPTEENPVAGIFIIDYIQSYQYFAEVAVFNSNPWYRGQYRNVQGVKQYDLHLFSSKWRFPFNILSYAWWEKQSLRFTKRMPKPDLIHLHGTAQRGKWALKLARYWDTPLVITEHTGPWSAISSRPAVLRRVKSVMESADLVMPVSYHLQKEIFESGIRPRKTCVLGNPVDTDFFKLRNQPVQASKRILFLGRLDPFKGGLRTLKAFNEIKEDFPQYQLMIAGDGVEAEQIKSFIEENDLNKRVQFLQKMLSRNEMLELFHRSSFLVFPSEFESFGLVGAEAMSAGLPVLLTDRTGPRDYGNDKNSVATSPFKIEEGLKRMIEKIDTFHPEEIRDSITNSYSRQRFCSRLRDELQRIKIK
jgi:glycosyltransferase involved in cell wall biosynthesis